MFEKQSIRQGEGLLKVKGKKLVSFFLIFTLLVFSGYLVAKEKLTEIEQKIKAISANECFAKYFAIINVEDDGSMYRITISLYPLFEPRSYDQIQTWTDAVCKSSKRILDNYGLVRNISVWAIRPIRISVAGDGGLIVYGRTLYDHHTDKYEFKSPKVLE